MREEYVFVCLVLREMLRSHVGYSAYEVKGIVNKCKINGRQNSRRYLQSKLTTRNDTTSVAVGSKEGGQMQKQKGVRQESKG